MIVADHRLLDAAKAHGAATLAHASAQLDRATSSIEDALRLYVPQDVTQSPRTRGS